MSQNHNTEHTHQSKGQDFLSRYFEFPNSKQYDQLTRKETLSLVGGQPFRIATCGLGARGRLAYTSGIAQDLADLWRGRPVNKEPRTHDYYEQQYEDEGPGAAFQRRSKAALNTGINGPIPMDTTGLTPAQRETVNSITDLASHYSKLLMTNPNESLTTLAEENISTALLFAQASRTGTLDTSIACGPRDLVGKALEIMTNEARRLAEEHLPWLTVNFHFGVQVMDINLDNPQKPILEIQYRKTGETKILPAYDLVIKSTGTTWELPVRDAAVAKNAFTDIPDSEALGNYLAERQSLDENGQIKPNTRILIGGSGLSAFDSVGILLTRTGIVTLDPSTSDGFRIDAEQASKYPGLITFFNRSQGNIVASRHALTASMPEDAALFTPEMILAQQLQKGQDPLQVYLEKARLLTAVYLNKLPKDVEPSVRTNEQFTLMAEENERLSSDPTAFTEPKMLRAAILSFFFSIALGSDPAEKNARLKQEYPSLVRTGYDAARSTVFNATHPTEGSPENSAKHVEAFRTFMRHNAAAPFPIHHLLTSIYRLGVIAWEEGAYSQLSWSETQEKFTLNNTSAELLIAPRLITPRADELSAKIRTKTLKPAVGEQVYDKGRFFRSVSGKPVHIIELGIPGHGSLNEDKLFLNAQWWETNCYSSAHQLMPTLSTTIHILENMFARQIPNPVDRLMDLYRQTLPPRSEFDEQVEALRKPFEDSHAIMAVADLAAKAYPAGDTFSSKMKKVTDEDARETIVSKVRGMGQVQEAAVQAYEIAMEKIKFEPFSLEGFEATTADFTATQIKEMKRIQDKELRDEYESNLNLSSVITSTTSGTNSMALKFLVVFFGLFLLSQMFTVYGTVTSVIWLAYRVVWLCMLNWLFWGALCFSFGFSRALVSFLLWIGKHLLF